ncbi:MAG TPA: hypothetical protein VMR70_04165, partial [Flavisolibacter sp.]|nr:hypothetical protein [Flavisolibacter sp.]
MVSTYEIAPSPVLQPFVRCFLYREFDATASELCRPMVASHEFVITFNLNDEQVLYRPPESGSPQTDEGMKSMMVMTGTSTQHTGFMVGKYRHRFFSI